MYTYSSPMWEGYINTERVFKAHMKNCLREAGMQGKEK